MNRPAIAALLALPLAFAATSALAEWRVDNGLAVVEPAETNSNLQLFAVACGDPFQLELYAENGPVLPQVWDGPADYFYQPGKIIATIDGRDFPLVAAGSEYAVVLYSEGTVAENHMAPVDRELIRAMRAGATLTFHFDISAANASDGSPYETFARVPLAGAADALGSALAACL
jgi:hypothetical protein